MRREHLVGAVTSGLRLGSFDEDVEAPGAQEWVLTAFLGEGAEGVAYLAVPLADPAAQPVVLKLFRDLPMFVMETLHHSLRVHEELYPDHPLRMSSDERLVLLTGEMLAEVDTPRLRVPLRLHAELRRRVVVMLALACGAAFLAQEPIGPVLASSGLDAVVDESIADHIEDQLDDELFVEDARPLLTYIVAGLRESAARPAASLFGNPLAVLLGLYAEDFISREELEHIAGTADFADRLRPQHSTAMLHLIRLFHAYLAQQLDDDAPWSEVSGRDPLDVAAVACRLVARCGTGPERELAAQWESRFREQNLAAAPRGARPRRVRPRRRPVARRLFGRGEFLRLSEVALDPAAYAWVSVGHTLASVHRSGFLHGDLSGANLFIDLLSGATTMLDPAPYDADRTIDPRRMATDFARVDLDISKAELTALLSGYTRTSRLIIDPAHPGFTDGLLDVLGGQVLSESRAATPVLTADQCDRFLGPLLAASGLTGTPSGRPADDRPADGPAALAVCALIVSGLDLRPALRAGGTPLGALGSPYVRMLLRRIYRLDDGGDGDDSAQVRRAPGVSAAAHHFLTVLAEQPGPRGPLEAEDQGPGLPRLALLNLLGGQGPARPDSLALLAAVTDVGDWLAIQADTGPAFDLSVRFAQLSLMALQRQEWPALERELRELTVIARHRRLSWFPDAFTAAPSDERHLPFLAYRLSRILLYTTMFRVDRADAVGVRYSDNLLWSANWRAFTLARRSVTDLLQAGADADEMSQRMLRTFTSQWADTAYAHLQAAVAIFGDRDQKVAILMDQVTELLTRLSARAPQPWENSGTFDFDVVVARSAAETAGLARSGDDPGTALSQEETPGSARSARRVGGDDGPARPGRPAPG
ncbi:RIO2 family protein [Streptacidiphilus rugosus]|uniref:hypothetical protein n=1 Tax=Streptacidiphilus rugosus TaxID=405783 RepID=UPI0005604874|nr:hypothetical protein [Streptacidiphilus rugosus]